MMLTFSSFPNGNMLKMTIVWSFVSLLCQFPSLTEGRWPSSGYHQTKLPSTEPLKVINIGAVLESSESIGQFFQAIEEVNMEPNVLPPGISLYAISNPPSSNPVRMVQEFCEKMIKSEVYAVVIDDADSPEAAVISQTCDFLNIPVIGLSNRNSYLSDTHMHSVYLRTVPPYSHQVDVWIEMLITLNYSHVVFIHGADYDGRTTFIRFQSLAEKSGIQIRSVIEYETGVTDIVDELEEADEEIQCRVYLLYANELEAQSIFLEVLRLNMTSPGYVWIVSEAALRATNVPDGVLALQLFNANNRASHIVDSIYIIGLAIRDMIPIENVTRPPSKCGDLTLNSWETGSTFYNYLRKQFLLYGKTGRVAFDGKGDRIDAEYEVVNRVRGRSVSIGQYAFSQSKMKMHLSLNINEIIWPGYQTTRPLGYVRPSHLRIVTIEEEPFIFFHPVSKAEECVGDTVPCGKTDPKTGTERMYCCSGYCIDFLVDLARRLNFTYTLYQVADGVYGNFEHVNGTDQPKVWTGLVGDLIYKKADMIVAPLTINPERSLYIEFSKPFKYQGITILEKKLPKRAGLASFLQPFEESLWLLVMLSVHIVALALYLLDRFSPFGRYKLPNSDVTEEDALNLSSAIWFAWGVLLNSGIGEGTPRSFSGRVLGMVWCGCAMIVIASYTANLAAFLVLERPTTSLTGINDARLRNPTTSFTYATVKASSVEMYFKRQVELKEMYEYMIDKNYPTVEDAVAAVKNDEISAFIWDSARLEWEAAKDCDLITAAEQFGRSGYGIGLVKNSFWTDQMNSAILSMHESGFMTDLDNKWILSEDIDVICLNRYDPVPTTLGLRNMAGVFILLGAGIVGGIALIVIEVVYKKRQVAQQKQLETARSASEKWKRFVQKRRLYRANIHALRQEQLRQEQLRSEKLYPTKLYESEQLLRDEKMTEGRLVADKSFDSIKRSSSSQHQFYQQSSTASSQYATYQPGTGQQRSQRMQTSSFDSTDHPSNLLHHQPQQHHHYDSSHHHHHQDIQPFTVERGLTEMKLEENRKLRKEETEDDCKMITPPSEYQRGYYQDQSKINSSLRATSPPPQPLKPTTKVNQGSGQLHVSGTSGSSNYTEPLIQHLPSQKQQPPPPPRPPHQHYQQQHHHQQQQQSHYQKPPPPPSLHHSQHQQISSSHQQSSSILPTTHTLHHSPPHVPPHQTHLRSLHQGYTASVTPSLSRSAPSSVEIEMAKASLKKSKPIKETVSSSSGNVNKGKSKGSSETSRKRFLKRESSMNYERGSTPDSYTRGGDSRRGTPSPNQGHLIKPPHALVYSSKPQDFNFSYGYTT